METKTRTSGAAAALAALIVAALARNGLDVGDMTVTDAVAYLIAAAATGVVSAAAGWVKRNGNLSPSTLEAADAPGG